MDQLSSIEVLTLVINGAGDGATDTTVAPFVEKIPNVKWVKFEVSCSLGQLLEAELMSDMLTEFEPYGPFRRAGEVHASCGQFLVCE